MFYLIFITAYLIAVLYLTSLVTINPPEEIDPKENNLKSVKICLEKHRKAIENGVNEFLSKYFSSYSKPPPNIFVFISLLVLWGSCISGGFYFCFKYMDGYDPISNYVGLILLLPGIYLFCRTLAHGFHITFNISCHIDIKPKVQIG